MSCRWTPLLALSQEAWCGAHEDWPEGLIGVMG